jgi:DNA invertase Pin-like site-specific DNA recombinase
MYKRLLDMLIGYARVSTREQDLSIQLEKLKHCDRIFEEKKSGTSYARPELNTCLDFVREGDTLVITRLDRLARSTLDLCNIAKRLEEKKVSLHVLDQHINTADATGRLMFNMLGAIAQFETEIRAERQAEGIQKAMATGTPFGRKYILQPYQAETLRQERKQGDTILTLSRRYGLSKSSVYRYIAVQIPP